MPTPRRTSLTFRSSIAAAALVVAGLAGCAKDDTTSTAPTGTTPPLTKDVLVSRANEICAAADKQITEIADTAPINNNSGQQTQDELRQVVAKITPIAQNAIDQLQSLTPPADDAALVRGGIAKMQASLDAANANPSNQLNPIGMPDESLYNYGLRSCFTKP
jgi:hypothetical protein